MTIADDQAASSCYYVRKSPALEEYRSLHCPGKPNIRITKAPVRLYTETEEINSRSKNARIFKACDISSPEFGRLGSSHTDSVLGAPFQEGHVRSHSNIRHLKKICVRAQCNHCCLLEVSCLCVVHLIRIPLVDSSQSRGADQQCQRHDEDQRKLRESALMEARRNSKGIMCCSNDTIVLRRSQRALA